MLYDSVCAIKSVAADLLQEQPIATSLATSLAKSVSELFSAVHLCHHGFNSSHLKKSEIQSCKVWRMARRMVFLRQ